MSPIKSRNNNKRERSTRVKLANKVDLFTGLWNNHPSVYCV